MTKKELIFRSLNREATGYIPVIPVTSGFAMSKAADPALCRRDPEAFTQIMVNTRRAFGYDGLWAGIFQGVVAAFGKGLTDKHGKISSTGDSTILTPADIKKIRPYHADDCPELEKLMQTVACMKRAEPEQPIFCVADNPSMSAAALMDGENYYKYIVREPNFIHDITELFMEPILASIQRIVDAGCDIIWLPEPTIGGTCISREHYETFCVPYNKRFNKAVKDMNVGLIVHTCGNWNDRFDIAATEGVDALHVAEADLPGLKREHGGQVAIMGQLPSVFTMMMKRPEEVYQEALEECRIAAVGGGFILSADCGLPAATPDENVRAMVRAARAAEAEITC